MDERGDYEVTVVFKVNAALNEDDALTTVEYQLTEFAEAAIGDNDKSTIDEWRFEGVVPVPA